MKYKRVLKALDGLDKVDVEGTLEVREKGGRVEYYLAYMNEGGKRRKRYLKVSEFEMARKVAQYSYNKKVLGIARRRVVQFERICRDFAVDELERVYEDLPNLRKELVVPALPSWSTIYRDWSLKGYKENGLPLSDYSFVTKKGDRVRSKSEKILADKFFDLGIPYKYECPLHISNDYWIYPDFTFLHPVTCEEIYWEHFGMMDDSQYILRAIKKLEVYQRKRIFVGRGLLVTLETSSHPLNEDIVNLLIDEFLVAG